MRTLKTTAGPLTAQSANNIATSQSLGAAGPLTLNGSLASGGVATITNQPQRIGIHSNGNDSALTWTVTGTNWSGSTISETLAGGSSSTVNTVLSYATVTSIVGSAATASTVTVGTTGVGDSPWLFFDEWANATLGMQFKVTGTVNYTLFLTYDDPNDYAFPTVVSAVNWDSSGSGVIAQIGNLTPPPLIAAPRWLKITLNSGTGSVTGTFRQFNVNPI